MNAMTPQQMLEHAAERRHKLVDAVTAERSRRVAARSRRQRPVGRPAGCIFRSVPRPRQPSR